MLGAAGEQLAVYNGVQVAFDSELQGTNRYVYMYLHSFISAGGQLVTLADGTKQFNIVDNLGSVRCIVSWDGTAVSTQAFDYKPFGDLQSAGEENRIGYFGEQRDKESDYFAMGFRLYDPEIGRFLAIDPLLDIQPSQTPYHYCFNNPTSFTDPTGLYPEKEKGDKVQEVVSMYFNDQFEYLRREFGWKMVFNFIDQWNTFAMVHNMNELERSLGDNEGSGEYGGGGGRVCSGSGSGRTGTNESGNGVYIGSMQLSKPKDWSVGEIAKVCEPADKLLNTLFSILQSFGVDKEVGYLLVRDNENESLSAEFFLGQTKDDWLDISMPPDGFTLSDNQIVIGFTHTHRGDLRFSSEDKIAISKFSLGEFEWTNVSKPSFMGDNAKMLSMMYFGLAYNWNGCNFSNNEAISWKYYSKCGDMCNLWNEISKISDWKRGRDWSFYKSVEVLYKKK